MQNLPILQEADLKGKIVLVRVDHNVAKEQVIKDPFRIDVTFGTLFNILSKGGKLILMSHVGRPKDKSTGKIDMDSSYDVKPIVKYLEKKLYTKFIVPDFKEDHENGGYVGIDTAINLVIRQLRRGEIDGIYLPNLRWFKGEQASGMDAEKFAEQLAGLADVYVNDAFGSWQAHTSTVGVTRHLPSYAGYLMQHEIKSLEQIYQPSHPLLAIIAGSKFDTKIGPLNSLLKKVDYLMMGGVIYNAYLCAKYDIKIKGVDEKELKIAKDFLKIAEQFPEKLIEPPFIVEADKLGPKEQHSHRTIDVRTLNKGDKLNYVLDIDPKSFEIEEIKAKILSSQSIFVNAVMGFMPHYPDGTKTMYSLIDKNREANKMYGGGDTLQEFRSLLPGTYISAVDDPNYYFFSGGGTILKAIHEGCVTGLAPVKALIENGGNEFRS